MTEKDLELQDLRKKCEELRKENNQLKKRMVSVDGKWISVDERYPDNEDYILVSFENYPLPDIAMYKEDKEGGAFYPADEERSYVSFGLFVNAWMQLPKRYKEQEQVEGIPEHPRWKGNFKREFEDVL